ncbi:hypothetical protein, partial [Sphingomonas pituitosa]|uniref:hypothetical protein n=1 Tax=Sphingomonas pituitosa TaxID=99597 RepID=UPI001C3F7DD1
IRADFCAHYLTLERRVCSRSLTLDWQSFRPARNWRRLLTLCANENSTVHYTGGPSVWSEVVPVF